MPKHLKPPEMRKRSIVNKTILISSVMNQEWREIKSRLDLQKSIIKIAQGVTKVSLWKKMFLKIEKIVLNLMVIANRRESPKSRKNKRKP